MRRLRLTGLGLPGGREPRIGTADRAAQSLGRELQLRADPGVARDVRAAPGIAMRSAQAIA